MPFHKNLSGQNIHKVYAFEYANETARLAASSSLLAEDEGKVARQLDNDTFWIYTGDISEPWSELGAISHVIDYNNPHQVTLEQARQQDNELSGNINLNDNLITNSADPINDQDLVNKRYLEETIKDFDWQESVKDLVDFTTNEPLPSGRYVNTTSGISNLTSQSVIENYIYVWNGYSWEGIDPDEGTSVWNENNNRLYIYDGSSWNLFGSYIDHNSLDNIQGGNSLERYHLSQLEKDNISNLSIIDDELFLFDSSRSKNLSVYKEQYVWSHTGNCNGQNLRFGVVNNPNAGPLIPFDSTITYITANSSGGLATKSFDLRINGSTIYTIVLSGGSFTSTNIDINLTSGDRINIFCSSIGAAVINPIITLGIKRRG